MPPIPRYTYPGNLIMQIKRAKGDVRELPVSVQPEPIMTQQAVWAFPDSSELAPKRLVNCANIIKDLRAEADRFRRYVCALDLRENESNHGIFSDLTDDQEEAVNALLSQLSPSQLGAFDFIKHTKHDAVFIQGPPGTGKTTFIVTFLQILWELNVPWIACAPSNSATDHMATVLQQKCPEVGAIRFHAYDNEARAIRRQEKDSTVEDEDKDNTTDKAEDKVDNKVTAADKVGCRQR